MQYFGAFMHKSNVFLHKFDKYLLFSVLPEYNRYFCIKSLLILRAL